MLYNWLLTSTKNLLAYLRQQIYIAMDYLDKKKKELRPEDFPKLKELAQTKSWWDSIDQLDRIIGEITFHYPETKNIMRQWSLDEDFWFYLSTCW